MFKKGLDFGSHFWLSTPTILQAGCKRLKAM